MDTPTLFNATTDDDVYVRVEGRLVRLPLAPRPVLLLAPTDPVPFPVRIPAINVSEDEQVEASIDWFTSVDVVAVMDVPARIDDTLYLVDTDVVRQFPHREDFVAPAMLSYVLTDGVDEYEYDEEAAAEEIALGLRRRVAVLRGITRNVAATADEGTVVLASPHDDGELDDWDQWEDPER